MSMTLKDLTRAIQQHIDTDMDVEVARGMAEHALGFFGFYNRIIDNALEPNDRNLFYMFQDWDLLTTESEENHPVGRTRVEDSLLEVQARPPRAC